MTTSTPPATPTAHHCYKHFQLTTTQQALVASVEKLIWKFAHTCTPISLRHHQWAVEESYDAALRCACLAAHSFEFPRGLQFSTYASGYMQSHIYLYWRRYHKNTFRRLVSLSAFTYDGLEQVMHASSFVDESNPLVDTCETVDRLLADANLLDREKMIVCSVFGYGTEKRKACEVAAELRLSKTRVTQIRDRGLAKLRQRAIELGMMQ